MFASVRALLSGIIDYAGLFPPAQLPLDQAWRNYLRYRGSPDSWLLGRFICPAARLSELAAFREEIQGLPSPLVVSALGRGGKDTADFLAGVRADLAEIAAFRRDFGDRAAVDVYEARLPAALLDPQAKNKLFALVGTTAFLLEKDSPGDITPFFEPPSPRTEVVRQALEILAADRVSAEAPARRRCRPAGLKIRCGGGDPSAIPNAEQLAFVITSARDRGLTLKFTAGLHQPLPRHDAALNLSAHGFLNLFIAGALAHAHGLSEESATQVLQNEDAARFKFSDRALTWQESTVPAEQIQSARRMLVASFGSCSFDEPRDGLRTLGLLDP